MGLPATLIVACATERVQLRYFALVLMKAYFDKIRLPSLIPGAFGTQNEDQLSPVFWFSRLTRVGIPSGGTSQNSAISGLIFAIQVAVRSQFCMSSEPLPNWRL